MGTDCTTFRTQSIYHDFFLLDSLANTRPTGYKMYLHISVTVNKGASIKLDSMRNVATSSNYLIGTAVLFMFAASNLCLFQMPLHEKSYVHKSN